MVRELVMLLWKRFKCNVFSDKVFSEKLAFCQQLSPDHSSPIPHCRHHETFGGIFKDERDFPKTQLQERSISTKVKKKSVTLPAISRKLHQQEDKCHQSNYSSSRDRIPTNVLGSEDNQNHCEESKVKTPEMILSRNTILSSECFEGVSSSVVMPQKLEDCHGIKECQNGTQTTLLSQIGCQEIEDSGHRKRDVEHEGPNNNVVPSCNAMMLGSFVLQLL